MDKKIYKDSKAGFKTLNPTYSSWFMVVAYLRKYVNPINHEP